jgi:hypothetical protein
MVIKAYVRSTSLWHMIQMQSMIQRCKHANKIWYINENATCICTSNLPTEAQKGKMTPSPPRKWANVAWSKGLVRISVSCFSVGTRMRSMFPFSSLSLGKWCLTSICLVLEWSTRFLATLTCAVTHERYMGTLLTKVTQCVCDPEAVSNN